MMIQSQRNLLRSYECLIIEFVIAIRLGGQFFVQLMNLLITGDIETSTIYAQYYRYILIVGTAYSMFLIINRGIYKHLRKDFLFYVGFVLLYVGLMYYYLKIDPNGTYSGPAATAKFSTVLNNVFLFGIVAILYATKQLNQFIICKVFVIINVITSIMYMNSIGLVFGDSFDGFLLQSTGFSSLAIGYLTGANIVVTIYLIRSWTGNMLLNYIITGCILALFIYILLMCGKTGPTLFSIFTSLFALKYSIFPRLKIKIALIWLISFIIIFLIFYRQFADILSVMNPRLAEKIIATIGSGDTSNRNFLFEEAYIQIMDNPFWGNYFELKRYNFYPHNFFLENMITWGILGTSLMLRYLYLAFLKMYYLLKNNSEYVWVAFVFMFSFLSAQTTGSLYGNYRFWFCLTVLIVLVYRKN